MAGSGSGQKFHWALSPCKTVPSCAFSSPRTVPSLGGLATGSPGRNLLLCQLCWGWRLGRKHLISAPSVQLSDPPVTPLPLLGGLFPTRLLCVALRPLFCAVTPRGPAVATALWPNPDSIPAPSRLQIPPAAGWTWDTCRVAPSARLPPHSLLVGCRLTCTRY